MSSPMSSAWNKHPQHMHMHMHQPASYHTTSASDLRRSTYAPTPMIPQTSELFFTRNVDDPRDCDIIGEHLARPFFCRFETIDTVIPPQHIPQKRTTVFRNDDGPVAQLDWGNADQLQLGYITLSTGHQLAMTSLLANGSAPHCRSFKYMGDEQPYEWRRLSDNRSYDLYNSRNGRIASYTNFSSARPSPVGPTFGLLQTTAIDELFLLQSLVALILNRWIDCCAGY